MAWITKRALALGLVTGLTLAVPGALLADGLSGAPYDICCSEKEREAARADLEAVDAELASLRLRLAQIAGQLGSLSDDTQRKIAALQTDLARQERWAAEARERIARLQASIQAKLAELPNQIKRLLEARYAYGKALNRYQEYVDRGTPASKLATAFQYAGMLIDPQGAAIDFLVNQLIDVLAEIDPDLARTVREIAQPLLDTPSGENPVTSAAQVYFKIASELLKAIDKILGPREATGSTTLGNGFDRADPEQTKAKLEAAAEKVNQAAQALQNAEQALQTAYRQLAVAQEDLARHTGEAEKLKAQIAALGQATPEVQALLDEQAKLEARVAELEALRQRLLERIAAPTCLEKLERALAETEGKAHNPLDDRFPPPPEGQAATRFEAELRAQYDCIKRWWEWLAGTDPAEDDALRAAVRKLVRRWIGTFGMWKLNLADALQQQAHPEEGSGAETELARYRAVLDRIAQELCRPCEEPAEATERAPEGQSSSLEQARKELSIAVTPLLDRYYGAAGGKADAGGELALDPRFETVSSALGELHGGDGSDLRLRVAAFIQVVESLDEVKTGKRADGSPTPSLVELREAIERARRAVAGPPTTAPKKDRHAAHQESSETKEPGPTARATPTVPQVPLPGGRSLVAGENGEVLEVRSSDGQVLARHRGTMREVAARFLRQRESAVARMTARR